MSPANYRSHLTGRTPRAADIVTFSFERPYSYYYAAGQWFVITFQGPNGALDHHFSHSSSPTEKRVEFTTRIRDSEFKQALDKLEVGAQVELQAPYGSFVVEPNSGPLVFLAGGIGITCVRSILRSLADGAGGVGSGVVGASAGSAAAADREIVLFFANRAEDAIPFGHELAALKDQLPRFRVVYVMSAPGEEWTGYRGHVDSSILDAELRDNAEAIYYASGPPGFVTAMREMLAGRGVEQAKIKFENFDGYV